MLLKLSQYRMTMKVFGCFNSMLVTTSLVLKTCNYQGYGFSLNRVYITIFLAK